MKLMTVILTVILAGCNGFAVNPQKTRLFLVCDDGRVISYESWGTEADAILLTQAFDGCIATKGKPIQPVDFSDVLIPGIDPKPKVNVVPFPETNDEDRDTMRP